MNETENEIIENIECCESRTKFFYRSHALLLMIAVEICAFRQLEPENMCIFKLRLIG